MIKFLKNLVYGKNKLEASYSNLKSIEHNKDTINNILTKLRSDTNNDSINQYLNLQIDPSETGRASIKVDNSEIRSKILTLLKQEHQTEDREILRRIISEESKLATIEGEGIPYNLRDAVDLLQTFGNPEDSLLIWQAKQSNFETELGFNAFDIVTDIGYEDTIAYLEKLGTENAKELIEYLQDWRDDLVD